MAGSASIKSYPGCLYGPASVLTIPTVQPCVLWAPAQHMDQSDLSHGTKCAARSSGRRRGKAAVSQTNQHEFMDGPKERVNRF